MLSPRPLRAEPMSSPHTTPPPLIRKALKGPTRPLPLWGYPKGVRRLRWGWYGVRHWIEHLVKLKWPVKKLAVLWTDPIRQLKKRWPNHSFSYKATTHKVNIKTPLVLGATPYF